MVDPRHGSLDSDSQRIPAECRRPNPRLSAIILIVFGLALATAAILLAGPGGGDNSATKPAREQQADPTKP